MPAEVSRNAKAGVDYWYRNKTMGAGAYAKLDQDHLTISVGEEKVFGGSRFTDSWPPRIELKIRADRFSNGLDGSVKLQKQTKGIL